MCGRYNLIEDARALVDFFSLDNSLDMLPRYNIAPSQDIAVVRAEWRGQRIVAAALGIDSPLGEGPEDWLPDDQCPGRDSG